jgi:hypothetical protein
MQTNNFDSGNQFKSMMKNPMDYYASGLNNMSGMGGFNNIPMNNNNVGNQFSGGFGGVGNE